MNKATYSAAFLNLTLDKASPDALQRQLAQALRDLVHNQKLRSNDRLPSSRSLAAELSVSRVTVTAVYDQLIAEGYLEGRRGSGVYVVADLTGLPLASTKRPRRRRRKAVCEPQQPLPFATATPDLREFPHRQWARLLDQTWKAPATGMLARADPFGWWPLREAIADHLGDWRGLDCEPDRVIVTSGLAEGIELVANSLFGQDDEVLVEDPGYSVLRRSVAACGQQCIPIRVDDKGFNIAHGFELRPNARAAIVTPSRQFPLGMVLSLSRRLALLSWATENDGYIIEDDFDGEYRFRGQPLPAMMSLDNQGRVIYVGSFSKVMFPALRLGYIVVPPRLVDRFARSLTARGPRASLICQPPLAAFMNSGDFATHIRRMRRIYSERQAVLLNALRLHATGLLDAVPEAGGMHIVARLGKPLEARFSDVEVAQIAADGGVSVQALSQFFAGPADLKGIVFGYAGFTEPEIDDAVEKLCRLIAAHL